MVYMRIAIVKLSALGDIIHSMVVLQFIKHYNKNIQIDWIVEERFKELLEYHPDIEKIHVVNIKKAKKKKSFFYLFKELQEIRQIGYYDLVIDMQGLIKSAIISRLIPSKQTIGFDRSSSREGLASLLYSKKFKFDYDKNIIQRNFELIKFALKLPFSFKEIENKLPFLHSKKKYLIDNLSENKKNIVLVPGASFKSKRYPVKKFAEIIKLLDANYIIIWGSNEEKLIAEKIKKLAPSANIQKKSSLDCLIFLISKCDLMIGSDTGPMHMGWALNIPSIILFGPTPGYRNSCMTDINKRIESESDVNPFKINKND